MSTYGERLLDALKAAGKSRRQLALALGITEQAVGNIVNGGPTTFFTARNSAEAAAFLGVEHYWLATGKGPRKPRASDWPFRHVELSEVAQLDDSQRLQLEGGMRLMLTQLWKDRHPDAAEPYKLVATLGAQGPIEEVPPELRALAERARALEAAMRTAADTMRVAVDGTPPPTKKKGT